MSATCHYLGAQRNGVQFAMHTEPVASECPVCGSELELHQPDADLPDRLLGICGACKSWFLVEGESRMRTTLIVRAEPG
jgi:hypothetical protein